MIKKLLEQTFPSHTYIPSNLDWYLSSVQLSDESLLIELLFQHKALFVVDSSHFSIKSSLISVAIIL